MNGMSPNQLRLRPTTLKDAPVVDPPHLNRAGDEDNRWDVDQKGSGGPTHWDIHSGDVPLPWLQQRK